jgi:branched-subunit amino acid aminotransferase/4-amino-4-deoxychorismate lyase
VAIRTFEVRDGLAWLGAGGGIVADSDPDAEVAEALGKARPLVSALGAELRPGPPRGGRRPAARALEGWLERPDPAVGVFETIAVRGGRAVDLERHLARLEASLASVYGAPLPADLAARIHAAVASLPSTSDGRLRVNVVPGAPSSVEVVGVSPTNSTLDVVRVRMVPLLLPGGLGPHKWRDRRLVEALEARHHAVPVFVDADGAVLEAAMANLWLLEGDALVTPPADGRILPGCTRARALALPGAREEPLDLDRLDGADAVLLTSSIAVLRVVDAGRPLPPADRLRALRQLLAADRPIGQDRVSR